MTDEPKEILYPSKKGRHAFEIVEALGDVTLTILHNNILDETESTLWKSDWHYHNLCEIVVLCSGDEHILFEDQTFVAMNPHDICIIPKGLSHFCSPVGERQKRISLLISIVPQKGLTSQSARADCLLLRILTELINEKNVPILLKSQPELFSNVSGALSVLQSGDPLTSVLVKHQLILFVLQCLSAVFRRSSDYLPSDEFDLSLYGTDTADIRKQLIEHFMSVSFRSCTVEMLAERLHLGVRQTNRIIRGHYGMNFVELLNHYRITVAQQLLLNGEKTNVIAEHVGYRSIGGFRKAFRRVTGLTPREFMQKYGSEGCTPPAPGFPGLSSCREKLPSGTDAKQPDPFWEDNT